MSVDCRILIASFIVSSLYLYSTQLYPANPFLTPSLTHTSLHPPFLHHHSAAYPISVPRLTLSLT